MKLVVAMAVAALCGAAAGTLAALAVLEALNEFGQFINVPLWE